MEQLTHAISIEGLCVDYERTGQGKPALQGISLDINRGSWTSMVGANGSGKSTLAKVIAGLCEPNEGTIRKAEDVRVHIVLQNPETQILGDTIYEELNLSLGDYVESDEARKNAIQSILAEVGLSYALETPTSKLSGGEKQLLNIAACVAAGANVFVLDEVTSMLDFASRDQVIQVMQKLHENGLTLIWLTHRVEELGWGERVIMLENGSVSYDGSTRDFLYGDSPDGASPCEQWGMELPYVIQVVKQLEKRGYSLPEQPLLAQELSEAIKPRCR